MRKLVVPKLKKQRILRKLLEAVIKGWKTRKILSGCKEVQRIRRHLTEIAQMLSEI